MPSNTIKKLVADINNSNSDGGGLWLPNIQRLFVWNEDQIERLFDSILRQYPLSSMMLWKTKDPIRHRKFIEHYHDKFDLKGLYQPDSKKLKRLVLDGQQRLQSLYMGLKGQIDGRTLHFDLLSGEAEGAEDVKFRFAFKKPDQATWPWVPLESLIYTKRLAEEVLMDIVKKHNVELEQKDRLRVTRNIARAKQEIEVTEAIIYQEIDGTDEDEPYSFDDIVEIFIRANSGGTKLSKSDLMFTLLTVHWDSADVEMDCFLEELNDHDRFGFNRDFVLKTAMTLLGKGAKYDVNKLRDEDVRKTITSHWSDITDSIKFVKDQIVEKTFIRSGKALTSYNALIPLIYFHYHYPDEWKNIRAIKDYLLRALLTGSFSGSPDGLIDRITTDIKKQEGFYKKSVFRIIEERGKSLQISSDALLYWWGYGSGQIHLIFNQWYESSYKPALSGHLPQVDHIFPQSLLKSVKDINPDTGWPVQVHKAWDINQLANCMLLTAAENGAGGKSDTPPAEWFADKPEEYLDLHCIPRKKSLWQVENYDKFIEARGILICEKFADLLLEEEDEE